MVFKSLGGKKASIEYQLKNKTAKVLFGNLGRFAALAFDLNGELAIRPFHRALHPRRTEDCEELAGGEQSFPAEERALDAADHLDVIFHRRLEKGSELTIDVF